MQKHSTEVLLRDWLRPRLTTGFPNWDRGRLALAWSKEKIPTPYMYRTRCPNAKFKKKKNWYPIYCSAIQVAELASFDAVHGHKVTDILDLCYSPGSSEEGKFGYVPIRCLHNPSRIRELPPYLRV
jgi:hypothetical protein